MLASGCRHECGIPAAQKPQTVESAGPIVEAAVCCLPSRIRTCGWQFVADGEFTTLKTALALRKPSGLNRQPESDLRQATTLLEMISSRAGAATAQTVAALCDLTRR
jgi:hypothetical protein